KLWKIWTKEYISAIKESRKTSPLAVKVKIVFFISLKHCKLFSCFSNSCQLTCSSLKEFGNPVTCRRSHLLYSSEIIMTIEVSLASMWNIPSQKKGLIAATHCATVRIPVAIVVWAVATGGVWLCYCHL
ncbi:unnamed protein product, partial [Meganyctiphanes norvegica]